MYKKKYMMRKPRRTLKRRISRKKRSITGLISKIMLKKCETKNTHSISENNTLYHNGESIVAGMLQTNQGIGDAQAGVSSFASRVGDQVTARGISVKIWLANKLDRPNVMYRITIFRYGQTLTTPTTVYASQSSSNIMLRDYDTDKIRVIKTKIINCQVGTSHSVVSQGTWTPREAHKLVKFWIPLKNKNIKYLADNSAVPTFSDYGVSIAAYDSYGTLTTDAISSYAINYKFYFKDP